MLPWDLAPMFSSGAELVMIGTVGFAIAAFPGFIAGDERMLHARFRLLATTVLLRMSTSADLHILW